MPVPGAAFRGHQVVILTALIKMGCFRYTDLGAREDALRRTQQSAILSIVFLHDDALEKRSVRTMVPDHIRVPLATVIVVEQRRVEAA